MEVVGQQDAPTWRKSTSARIQKRGILRVIVEESSANQTVANNEVEGLLKSEMLRAPLLKTHVQIAWETLHVPLAQRVVRKAAMRSHPHLQPLAGETDGLTSECSSHFQRVKPHAAGNIQHAHIRTGKALDNGQLIIIASADGAEAWRVCQGAEKGQ